MNSIPKPDKIHKNPAEIKVEFSGKNFTPYGGLGLFNKFLRKLGVEKVLDKINPAQKETADIPQLSVEGRSRGYKVGRKIVSLVYGLVCGLERPFDTK